MLPLEFLGGNLPGWKAQLAHKAKAQPWMFKIRAGAPGSAHPGLEREGRLGHQGTRRGAAVRRPSACQNFLADT